MTRTKVVAPGERQSYLPGKVNHTALQDSHTRRSPTTLASQSRSHSATATHTILSISCTIGGSSHTCPSAARNPAHYPPHTVLARLDGDSSPPVANPRLRACICALFWRRCGAQTGQASRKLSIIFFVMLEGKGRGVSDVGSWGGGGKEGKGKTEKWSK